MPPGTAERLGSSLPALCACSVCLLCVPALCDAFVRVTGQAISQTSWCGTVPPGSRCVGRPDRSMMVSSIFSPIAW